MSDLLKFTDQNFKAEVLDAAVPVLVDFSAVWCGPCKTLAPLVEELAKEFAGQVKVGKLDIDEDRETPTKYDVMAVPTLIFFKGGKEQAKITGLRPKAVIREQIEALLAKA
ncbi:MAG: thioredoxin [Planctomycetes bacterium]|nr:thioredoxin [Planctomycetota bacterium]